MRCRCRMRKTEHMIDFFTPHARYRVHLVLDCQAQGAQTQTQTQFLLLVLFSLAINARVPHACLFTLDIPLKNNLGTVLFFFSGSLYHQLTGLTRNAFRSHELDVGGNAPPCERRASVEAECVRSESAQKGASSAVRRKCPRCGSPFAQNKCAMIVLAFCSLAVVPYLSSSAQSSRR